MTQPTDPRLTPVIIGIGEIIDRPDDVAAALEPVGLMAAALQRADLDGGGNLLASVDSIDLVGQITWRYANPVKELCQRLKISPKRAVNASMGGETPIRLVHEAALSITRGEAEVCAIVGGEAMHALGKARKAQVQLPWTPAASAEDTVRVSGSRLDTPEAAKKLGVRDPTNLYPLYENAFQNAHHQSPGDARAASAALWARYAAVAAQNPFGWIRSSPSAETIATVTPDNRLIAWPYPKLMVANPTVNQGSAIIVTSLQRARDAGVSEDRLVYIWDGAAAKEPGDFLQRDRYDRSAAQTAVLQRAVEIAGGDARIFDHVELYSCFPVVPKMALEVLALKETVEPTVAGGITFFGGPMNNYMSHAVCAMVRCIRNSPTDVGLLYGQGGFVDKHHALVVSGRPDPSSKPMRTHYSVQAKADQIQAPSPAGIASYEGSGTVETFTVLYGRVGEIIQGVVVGRTPKGERFLATVDAADKDTLSILTRLDRTAVGTHGYVRTNNRGDLEWTVGTDANP